MLPEAELALLASKLRYFWRKFKSIEGVDIRDWDQNWAKSCEQLVYALAADPVRPPRCFGVGFRARRVLSAKRTRIYTTPGFRE